MLTKETCPCVERKYLFCIHPTRAEMLEVCKRVDAHIASKGALARNRSSLGRWLHRNNVLPGRAVCVRYAHYWIRHGLRGLLAMEWVRPGPMNTLYVYEGFKGLL